MTMMLMIITSRDVSRVRAVPCTLHSGVAPVFWVMMAPDVSRALSGARMRVSQTIV